MVVSAVEKGAIIHKKKNEDNRKSKVELESFCK